MITPVLVGEPGEGSPHQVDRFPATHPRVIEQGEGVPVSLHLVWVADPLLPSDRFDRYNVVIEDDETGQREDGHVRIGGNDPEVERGQTADRQQSAQLASHRGGGRVAVRRAAGRGGKGGLVHRDDSRLHRCTAVSADESYRSRVVTVGFAGEATASGLVHSE